MFSLGQVIQLHISPFELLTGEEGDKMHQFYQLNLPPQYHLTPPSSAERHLKDVEFKAQSTTGSLGSNVLPYITLTQQLALNTSVHTYCRKAPNPGNIPRLRSTAFLDGLSCILTFKITCSALVYSYPGTHSAFLCYCEEVSYSTGIHCH